MPATSPHPMQFIVTRRFAPLFVTQFLGAFNDNLFKTALLFLLTFHAGVAVDTAATMVTAAAVVFIVPFFLFSGIAGRLADSADKARVARWVKVAEVAILGLGAIGFLTASMPLLFAVLFAMGTHSTIFGPVKYAILPQHLAPNSLLAGTGLVEGGTFVAILLGQIAGGLLPTGRVAAAMIVVAAAGLIASRFIPPAPPADGAAAFDLNPVRASASVLRGAFAVRAVWHATLALSWFWGLGTVYTSQFVPLVRSIGASEATATLYLATFTIGIAAGSAAVSRLLGGAVSARAAPLAAATMAAASVALAAVVGSNGPATLILLFVLAAAGGVLSVPLYAILQTASGAASRASAVAANNIVNAAFQVGATLAAGAAVAGGASIPLVLAVGGGSALFLIPMLRRL